MPHPAFAAILALLPGLVQAAECRITPVTDPKLGMTSCRVERQGDAGGRLIWQSQRRGFRPFAEGHGDIMLSVMVVSERGAPIAWTEPDDGWAARPHRLESASGSWLHLPIEGAGSARRSLDEVWLKRPGMAAWERLAVDAWQAKAAETLRPVEEISPVWRLDLRRMRISGMITREGDPGCCPSAGRYTAWLVPREGRLELRRFRRR